MESENDSITMRRWEYNERKWTDRIIGFLVGGITIYVILWTIGYLTGVE